MNSVSSNAPEAAGAEEEKVMAARDEADRTPDATWRLSFRVHHPSADLSALADRIGDAFGMDPEVLWRHGEPYPQAKPAGQVRRGSYCVVPFADDEGTVVAALGGALNALAPLRAELAAIVASGGALDFFIGLFVDSMMGATLSPVLLARLADAQIALDFDIYGSSWDATPDVAE
jgi:hypothetical protein